MSQVVTKSPVIRLAPEVDHTKGDIKMLGQYLEEVAPTVKEAELRKFGAEYVFVYPDTNDPITYSDGVVERNATFHDALRLKKSRQPISPSLPTTGPITNMPLTDNLLEENGLLQATLQERNAILQERNAQLERSSRNSRMIGILAGVLVFVLLLLGVYVGILIGQNNTLANENAAQQRTIAKLSTKPTSSTVQPYGLNQWITIENNGVTDTQEHSLVGTTLNDPLYVEGNDLELSWLYQGEVFQVKNHTYERGIVIIPSGSQILLLNMRGPALKSSITPGVRPGITYVLEHHPTGSGFVEDHSEMSWPLPTTAP